MKNLNTSTTPTWCPGCFNFQILAGVKKVLADLKGETAIVTGIGCHAKLFDYVNLPGINTLHGRVPPTCLGLKIAKPDLNVIGFSGDGDAYAEGMAHTIAAARYNSNFKYVVHNNQVFALTVGQPTPTSPKGFVDKTTPRGVKIPPINPIKLMLSAGATFVARVFADINSVEEVLKEAMKHKGFAFIEVIQPCIIFQPQTGYKEKIYNLQESGHDKSDLKSAMERADEFDYQKVEEKTKIPTGIFYQTEKPIFEKEIRKD
ncbi:2-oxoacid:ferredoxin oxidoreductase subunit beta [archaeon]|jgi:2-oxoglutarate/2-oxoacid ferredoxin oxidoreductase subunit beta|nr:2-oxoacid:ferredoxin oxidoreductase subunit beta [archaeon]MBT4373591.1 2-oxoacid:ferredoxin oxidoreductase subunit beta [archaeon]MBT4532039.1 2-oxoacid:ferredoxin oxidoreductase subunit beta [archaeon]MBT7001706.1 2-oxoacid:ferredoxin oxidoreductase subunit beta [archaeon]MBT7282402.1 2-oxoacid:ferredoxin oxidoreductase subunit beta [archaeon]